MTVQKYKTKAGVEQFRPVMTANEFRHAPDMGEGFCLACGTMTTGVEPDARRYTCESCEAPKVYGLEELLMMDLLIITE